MPGHRLIQLNEQAMPLLLQLLFFSGTPLVRYLPSYRKLVKLITESFDVCKQHLEATLDRGGSENALVFRLTKKFGKEVALVMGIDALQVG